MDSLKRFSDRVEYYRRYRPSYPKQMLTFLEGQNLLISEPPTVVADLGAGTGILSRLLLQRGYRVFLIEPNAEMRVVAERDLVHYEMHTTIEGTAEATTLPAASVDLVTIGQAFHWFDRPAAGRECRRILRPGGNLAIIYNEWVQSAPLIQEYMDLLERHCSDFRRVSRTRLDYAPEVSAFFDPFTYQTSTFAHAQYLELDGLQGRALSSSYTPLPGQPGHESLMNGLASLFRRFAEDGRVRFPYTTVLYWGRFRPA